MVEGVVGVGSGRGSGGELGGMGGGCSLVRGGLLR